MLRYLLIAVTVANCVAGFPSGEILDEDFNHRIVNGSKTSIRFHPYQVSLQRRSTNYHICGGSLISEDIILTAAHCVESERIDNLQVRLGSSFHNRGGIIVKVSNFLMHEDYVPENYKNDIALLKLEKPVKKSPSVQFIKMAKTLPETGTPVIVTGWGKTCHFFCPFSKRLQKVRVSLLDRQTCSSKEYAYGGRILDGMICAYAVNRDSCDGDSGGPLVAKSELVGIVSWGESCAAESYPGVYTNVAEYYSWVQNAIKRINK